LHGALDDNNLIIRNSDRVTRRTIKWNVLRVIIDLDFDAIDRAIEPLLEKYKLAVITAKYLYG